MDLAIYILAGIGGATIIVLLVSLFNHMFRSDPDLHVEPFLEKSHEYFFCDQDLSGFHEVESWGNRGPKC